MTAGDQEATRAAVESIRASIEARVMELELDGVLLSRLLLSLLARMPVHLEKLAGAIARSDTEGVEREAHILVNFTGNIGVRAIADASREIECLARDCRIEDAHEALRRLYSRAGYATIAIDEVLATLRGPWCCAGNPAMSSMVCWAAER